MVINAPKKTGEIDRRAVPELLLKQQIAIIKRDAMIEAYSKLSYNAKLNRGHVLMQDKAELEARIISVFMHIKDMVTAQIAYDDMNESQRKVYGDLMRLQKSQHNFDKNRLVDMMNFLLASIHSLNLSNLLIKETDPFEEFERSLDG